MRDDMGMIEQWLLDKKQVRLTAKGRKWAMNLEATVIMLGILLAFGIVGSIESGRWFG